MDEFDKYAKVPTELSGLISDLKGIAPSVPTPSECRHSKCVPEFDEEEASRLEEAPAIRKRFPRFWGKCPDCGVQLIQYASAAHYIMGDW